MSLAGVLDAVSWALLVVGGAFCVIGGVGLVRLRDFYSRTHAVSLGDTLGAGLILVGLILQAPSFTIFIKLSAILLFLFLTSPAVDHALAKAAYAWGVRSDDPRHARGSSAEEQAGAAESRGEAPA